MSTMIRKLLPASFAKSSASPRRFEVTLSTETPDREHDRVGQGRWTIPPHVPLLWQHNRDELPLGRVRDIVARGRELRGVVEFPPVGIYDKADTILGLIASDIIQSVSIGFLTTDTPKPNALGGLDFDGRLELLELSAVNLPANVEARIHREADRTAMQKWLQDEEVVLELDDEQDVLDVTGFTPSELARLTGHASRQHRRSEPYEPVFDVQPDDVRQVLAATLPSIIRSVIAREVKTALARARGRVD